jgi:hypothetical protein
MINVIEAQGEVAVWTDTEDGQMNGRCLAINHKRQIALSEALAELTAECLELQRLLAEEMKR